MGDTRFIHLQFTKWIYLHMTYLLTLCGRHESNYSSKYIWYSMKKVKKMDIVPFKNIYRMAAGWLLAFRIFHCFLLLSCIFSSCHLEIIFEHLTITPESVFQMKGHVLSILFLLPPQLPPPLLKQLFIQNFLILSKELLFDLLCRLDSMKSSWSNYFIY